MRITLKLFAGLDEYLPRDARENTISLELPQDASAHDVLDRLRVPRERAHLVLLNGVYLGAAERDATPLQEGDVLAAWPPVAGG